MKEFQPIKEGKVREIYDNGDSLIMVATDRISAFDVILKNKVTNKGKVLTQMSKFWFDYTRDVLPNHMLSVDTKDMPEFFQQPQFEGKCMKCRKLTMLVCLLPLVRRDVFCGDMQGEQRHLQVAVEIGRASCRERVLTSV